MTVDLPRWPLADRLSLVLAVATAPVVEAVLARYPEAPAGAGVVVACLLVAALCLERRRRPRVLELRSDGGWLHLADGSRRRFRPGTGCRLLGSGVVMHWRSPGRRGALWLTAADLPREALRALAVHLVATRGARQ